MTLDAVAAEIASSIPMAGAGVGGSGMAATKFGWRSRQRTKTKWSKPCQSPAIDVSDPPLLTRTRQFSKASSTKSAGIERLTCQPTIRRACGTPSPARRGHIAGFVKSPRQHGRQRLGRIEQRLFLGMALGERVGQVDKLNKNVSSFCGSMVAGSECPWKYKDRNFNAI